MLIEPVTPEHRGELLALAVRTGLFTPAEAEGLLGAVLDGLAVGALPGGHEARVCRLMPGSPALGWTYFAPDPHADGVWNLWWIGADPKSHGTGVGARLLLEAERIVAASGGRLLIVETSAAEGLARARRFYVAQGYRECGRFPDFYAEGEAKVVFARRPRAGGVA